MVYPHAQIICATELGAESIRETHGPQTLGGGYHEICLMKHLPRFGGKVLAQFYIYNVLTWDYLVIGL